MLTIRENYDFRLNGQKLELGTKFRKFENGSGKCSHNLTLKHEERYKTCEASKVVQPKCLTKNDHIFQI